MAYIAEYRPWPGGKEEDPRHEQDWKWAVHGGSGPGKDWPSFAQTNWIHTPLGAGHHNNIEQLGGETIGSVPHIDEPTAHWGW